MLFTNINQAETPLVFIPNLLKPSGASARGSIRPACPTRHPTCHPTVSPSPHIYRLPAVAVLSRHSAPTCHTVSGIVSISAPESFHTLPLIGVPTSEPDLALKSTNGSNQLSDSSVTPTPQRRGHRHTEESRRKIGIANRGNTPWNKGRRHSEETKRKIAENTKRAMLRPEMRQMLQQRAKGRKHTEATKLKIRETARLTRGTVKSAKRRRKKCPVPFAFAPDVIKHLNDCVAKQIEETFTRDERQDFPKYVVREKRVVSEGTRQKLSRRIKEMWDDPDYRSRVASGVEERNRRLAEQHKKEPATFEDKESVRTKTKSSTKRRARPRRSEGPRDSQEAMNARFSSKEINRDDDADIVLDPDSLKGWTIEDLGIVGTHEAGRIDENTVADISGQDELNLPLRSDEEQQFDSIQADGFLPNTGTTDGTEILSRDRPPSPPGSPNTDFASPLPAIVQELDFSRLDIAKDCTFSSSYGNHENFFEERVTSFAKGRGTDADFSAGSIDRSDDYFSTSGIGKERTVRRDSPNYLDEEISAFDSF